MHRRLNSVRHVDGYGRRGGSDDFDEDTDYVNDVLGRMRRDIWRRRQYFRHGNEGNTLLPQPIEVDTVVFYSKENSTRHHTENYDLLDGDDPSPVLRRGQTFFMVIRFKRPFRIDEDKIRVELSFGPKKMVGKGTLVVLPVTSASDFTLEKSSWDICMLGAKRTDLTVKIQIPYVAGVGLWRMKIHSQAAGNERTRVYDCKENIYILFNPWCKDDPVYMPDAICCQEYVLNDVGKIYVGNYNSPTGRPWAYGQFEDVVLPASIFLLEKSGLDYTARSNPVKVVRAISAMVNSNDEGGVLIGKWSGNYEDGNAPGSWTGSAAILEQYLSGGGKPVKYGQCWVFSGVCTTVCRAIGIPCRSVTNFVSAHDTDDSLTVDVYFDCDGKCVKNNRNDSIWNFHVWNDCWMARPDLPTGYGGWQAVDATPQETSEGVYRAGPASVVAIQRGEISYLYDTPFVFAEVNADVFYWQVDGSNSELKKLGTHTYQVGELIATKKAGIDVNFGNGDMEDISLEYKSTEGSYEERMAVLNAVRRTNFYHRYNIPSPEKEDVKFKLKDIKEVMIGSNFQIIVELENKSNEKRTVTAVLSASTIYYTGIIAREVERKKEIFILQPRQREELGIKVTADQYLDKLVDYSMLKIYAIATVEQTQQTWAEEDDFRVEKPPLKIETFVRPKVGRGFSVTVSFTNPLERALKDCVLTLEGPGLVEPRRINLNDVGPKEIMSHLETMTPRKAGLRKITAVFTSNQLIEVTGSLQVEVEL